MARWVAWQRAYPDGGWSIDHLTEDDRRTLCGRRIPHSGEIHRYELGFGNDLCKRCVKKEQSCGVEQSGSSPAS